MLLAVPALAAMVINWRFVPGTAAAAGHEQPAGSATRHTPFVELLRQPSVWLIALAYMFFNVGYYGYVGWMPSYLAAAHGIDLKAVGLIGGIPFIFGIVGLLVLGWVAGAWLYAVRVQFWAATYVLTGGFLFLAYQSSSLAWAIAGLSGAAFFLFGSLAVFAGVMIDYAPADSRASFSAVATTAGQLGGIVAPLAIGTLVKQTGSYAGGFAFMIVALVVAAVAALGLTMIHRLGDAPALSRAYPTGPR